MAARRRAILCSIQLLMRNVKPVRRHIVPVAAWSGPRLKAAEASHPSLMPRQVLPSWTVRAMSCCAGLGSPPPREIVVEYSSCSNGSGGDDYTDQFIKLANAIEEAYPEFVVSGNPDVLEPRNGAFEITSGDLTLFSKLKVKRLPELSEILRAIDALPPLQCELS